MDTTTTKRTLDETLALLPHVYPFRFLDRLIEINNTGATAIKTVSSDGFFFAKDNTGSALPALFLAEALAQLAGLVMANANCDDGSTQTIGAYLVGINNLTLKRAARAGECLKLSVETIIAFETMAKFSAKAAIGEEEILECELTMALA